MSSVGEMAQDGHTFGQRQPPLYVTIQKILDKYPDGQIFKVRTALSYYVTAASYVAHTTFVATVVK